MSTVLVCKWTVTFQSFAHTASGIFTYKSQETLFLCLVWPYRQRNNHCEMLQSYVVLKLTLARWRRPLEARVVSSRWLVKRKHWRTISFFDSLNDELNEPRRPRPPFGLSMITCNKVPGKLKRRFKGPESVKSLHYKHTSRLWDIDCWTMKQLLHI